jgi:hypothetical protein
MVGKGMKKLLPEIPLPNIPLPSFEFLIPLLCHWSIKSSFFAMAKGGDSWLSCRL